MNSERRFVFQATGPGFHPWQAGLTFSQSFEPGTVATFGGTSGRVAHFGGALYVVPDEIECQPRQSHYAAVFAHLSQVLAPLRAAGATEFVLHMHRTFGGACNEEFTREELRLLASLGCHFFYVARTGSENDA